MLVYLKDMFQEMKSKLKIFGYWIQISPVRNSFLNPVLSLPAKDRPQAILRLILQQTYLPNA
jgi:hypothetical protein